MRTLTELWRIWENLDGILTNLEETLSKSQSKLTIAESILEFLPDDEETEISEIYKAVSGKKSSIDTNLSRLRKSGKIRRIRKGVYCKNKVPDAPVVVENPREESENIETINKMLTIYDKVFDNIALTIEDELTEKATIAEKIDLIKSLRWLGATVDQLMKRWYLVHRGYDSNTRQAQEDAKKKTVDREKQSLETSPPEDQVVVVAEYHTSVREIWDTLPEPEKKRHTV